MSPRDLLARLTFALSTVAVPLVACGGETSDGTGSTGPGGSSSAGSGGTSSGGAAGSGDSCQRPLPDNGGQTFGKACRVMGDCAGTGGGRCLLPGQSVCGGMGGLPPICTDDAACGPSGSGVVCQRYETGPSYCQSACSDDTMCGASQRCNVATGHCEARPCGGALACPTDSYCGSDGTCQYQRCNAARPCGTGQLCDAALFTCGPQPCTPGNVGDCPDTFTCAGAAGAKTGVCERTTCSCDTECGKSGFCLQGTCYESAGSCDGGVACGRPLLTDEGPRVSPLLVGAASGWST